MSITKRFDQLILFFLGLSFVSSQLSIAASSIGVAGLIILFAIKLITSKDLSFPDKNLLYILLMFFLWQIITSFLSNNPPMALIDSLKKASLYFIFICSIKLINSKSSLIKLLSALFIFSALVSLYESVKYIIDFNAQDQLSLADFRLSYFGYPITLGEIKMLILLLIIPFVLSREKYILNKWVLIIISIPILLSLYFTNTRNALLGLFIGLIVIGIMKHRYFLIGFVAAVILFLSFAPHQFNERIKSIVEITHPSNEARFRMWETGLKMIKDSPVAGYGDVDIPAIYRRYRIPETYGEGSHMHNNFVHLAVLYGVTGLIIWLGFIVYIIFRQFRIYRKVKGDEFFGIISLTSISCMIAFLVSGLTEWNFGDAEFAAVLWFTFSLPFIAEKVFRPKEA